MSIITTIKGWINMILKRKAKDEFSVEPLSTDKMEAYIRRCINVYKGKPEWAVGDVVTVNFAKAICSETARLATLATKVTIDGSARAEYLQEQIDKLYYNLRHWVEYGMAYGTVILKPNLDGVSLFTPENFLITDSKNGDVTGCVFLFSDKVGDTYYTRIEYHRFAENGDYLIDNKCYTGKSENEAKDAVDIDSTPWAGLYESVTITDMDRPLFAVLRTPQANNIEFDSVLSMPIFADALVELRDLDIAYSRNANEIDDSKRIVLIDSDKLFPFGQQIPDRAVRASMARDKMKLPSYVNVVEGDDKGGFYQEINPALSTATRLDGINALLSQIGYKIGFSNGYFVFNEKTGLSTATQVEAEEQRTIQFIKDVRDKVEACLGDLIYAMNALADLYQMAPSGEYEVTYDFGDITYNRDEDRSRWWGYVQSGKMPAWMYFTKFEGMSEEDAKALVAEAQAKTEQGLFDE